MVGYSYRMVRVVLSTWGSVLLHSTRFPMSVYKSSCCSSLWGLSLSKPILSRLINVAFAFLLWFLSCPDILATASAELGRRSIRGWWFINAVKYLWWYLIIIMILGTWLCVTIILCVCVCVCMCVYVYVCAVDPHKLGIRCRLNGKTVQDSNTEQMVHKTEALVAFISQ